MSGDGSTTVVVSTETVSETVDEDSNLNFSLYFTYTINQIGKSADFLFFLRF